MQETIKAGYKQTEVGVIPEDWDVKPLPKALDFIGGKAHEQHIIPYGDFVVVNSKFISSEGQIAKYSDNNFCPARRGDILMVMSDLPNGKALAKCFLVNEDRRYAVNQRVCILRPRNADSRFFFYQLNRKPYFLAFDDGVQQTHLLNGVFRACPVIVPPPEEQRAIAAALSDADGLIAALEALIAKKRDLKQAAMQQLLTGKTRLPGFSGEWEVKRLGEIAQVFDGTHQTPKYVASGVPFYSVEHVTSGDFENTKFITKEEHKYLTRTVKVERGDILMTRIGSIGDCKLIDWDVDASYYVSLALLKIKNGSSAKYIEQFSATHEFRLEVEKNSLMQAIPKKINLGPISRLEIRLPPTESEQTAIAEVLSGMDTDLAALEAQRDKAKEIKQGMMQELLTGKVRLL